MSSGWHGRARDPRVTPDYEQFGLAHPGIPENGAEPRPAAPRPSAMNASEHSLMHGRQRRGLMCAASAGGIGLLTAGGLILSGCSGQPLARVIRADAPRAADVSLVRFTSCADALSNLRAAARAADLGGASAGRGAVASLPSAAGAAGSVGAAPASATSTGSASSLAGSYSGTNTATAGVDEPDLVKTDGHSIITVIGNVLRVVDVRTRQLTGLLDLTAGDGIYAAGPASLLVAGNHALVIFGQSYGIAGAQAPGPPQYGTAAAVPILGPRMELIDLSGGRPQVISQYTMDGALVDARQVGSVVRVVVHSAPRIYSPYPAPGQSAQPGAIAPGGLPGALPGGLSAVPRTTGGSGAAMGNSAISAWLPRYQLTDGGGQRTGMVDCAAVSRPVAATYSGTSMLTVLTFDLNGTSLGDGEPVTVVADGDTVYSDGTSLFIADDYQWTGPPVGVTAPGPPTAAPQQYTGLYKFNISSPGPPVYEAAGAVPGWLLGSAGMTQYSLSQWNGSLRVATTADSAYAGWGGPQAQSAVYVLQQVGSQLVTVGKVGGLGYGEQIYAVRFAGPVGYVVTFRQIDPLYTVDLSDPAQPRVAGQLLLSGYSAYLHPIDATHLIGVGQDATADGLTQGTQISLFDVSDPAAPVRLAVFRLPFGHSEAEFDPHAFLYWPATRLLVIPVQLPSGIQPQAGPGTPPPPVTSQEEPAIPVSEALVLYVGAHSIAEVGIITHPATPGYPTGGQIRRSLVAGGALWTLSDAGLKANDLATLEPLRWVPFG
jgi:hypothetical protein